MSLKECIPLSTENGEMQCQYFENTDGEKCLLVMRKPWGQSPFVRIHSACMFSESLHSNDCDCALQLNASMKALDEFGGVIVYLFQEGRGIGLLGKIQAIRTQLDHGIGTAAAFKELGHKPDIRSYTCAAEALRALGITGAIRLATSNPLKIQALQDLGFEIEERITLRIDETDRVANYLAMKRSDLGHL